MAMTAGTHIFAQPQRTPGKRGFDGHKRKRPTEGMLTSKILDLPALLRFAGSMVPEPSTTSPCAFIVAWERVVPGPCMVKGPDVEAAK